VPLQYRFDLLFNPLLVDPAHAFDLRSQVSNLLFIGDLLLNLAANQTGEDIIVKREICAGCN
jgi:hypothetical protein